MRLEDKVALITGAGSGMGASTARIFAREGAKVAVADVLGEEGRGASPTSPRHCATSHWQDGMLFAIIREGMA
jgi:NAD(P)-dependent dehydrogenase (short-subunit alcohol dehydrogenase family)